MLQKKGNAIVFTGLSPKHAFLKKSKVTSTTTVRIIDTSGKGPGRCWHQQQSVL